MSECRLRKQAVWQEREISKNERFVLQHSDQTNFILNTSALHSYKLVEEYLGTNILPPIITVEAAASLRKRAGECIRNKQLMKKLEADAKAQEVLMGRRADELETVGVDAEESSFPSPEMVALAAASGSDSRLFGVFHVESGTPVNSDGVAFPPSKKRRRNAEAMDHPLQSGSPGDASIVEGQPGQHRGRGKGRGRGRGRGGGRGSAQS